MEHTGNSTNMFFIKMKSVVVTQRAQDKLPQWHNNGIVTNQWKANGSIHDLQVRMAVKTIVRDTNHWWWLMNSGPQDLLCGQRCSSLWKNTLSINAYDFIWMKCPSALSCSWTSKHFKQYTVALYPYNKLSRGHYWKWILQLLLFMTPNE